MQGEQPTVSVEEVRKGLAEKSQDGMVDEIRMLLKEYNASRLSDIDPADLPDLLEKAKALNGGDIDAA